VVPVLKDNRTKAAASLRPLLRFHSPTPRELTRELEPMLRTIEEPVLA
jgi:hypothetical protein